MNRILVRRACRAALSVACAGYFGAIAVIGQVADGNPVPEPPAFLLDVRR